MSANIESPQIKSTAFDEPLPAKTIQINTPLHLANVTSRHSFSPEEFFESHGDILDEATTFLNYDSLDRFDSDYQGRAKLRAKKRSEVDNLKDCHLKDQQAPFELRGFKRAPAQ